MEGGSWKKGRLQLQLQETYLLTGFASKQELFLTLLICFMNPFPDFNTRPQTCIGREEFDIDFPGCGCKCTTREPSSYFVVCLDKATCRYKPIMLARFTHFQPYWYNSFTLWACLTRRHYSNCKEQLTELETFFKRETKWLLSSTWSSIMLMRFPAK